MRTLRRLVVFLNQDAAFGTGFGVGDKDERCHNQSHSEEGDEYFQRTADHSSPILSAAINALCGISTFPY